MDKQSNHPSEAVQRPPEDHWRQRPTTQQSDLILSPQNPSQPSRTSQKSTKFSETTHATSTNTIGTKMIGIPRKSDSSPNRTQTFLTLNKLTWNSLFTSKTRSNTEFKFHKINSKWHETRYFITFQGAKNTSPLMHTLTQTHSLTTQECNLVFTTTVFQAAEIHGCPWAIQASYRWTYPL